MCALDYDNRVEGEGLRVIDSSSIRPLLISQDGFVIRTRVTEVKIRPILNGRESAPRLLCHLYEYVVVLRLASE